jgi:hypothetical protein
VINGILGKGRASLATDTIEVKPQRASYIFALQAS